MPRSVLTKITGKISAEVSALFKMLAVRMKTQHVYGPKKIVLEPTDAVLVCLLKDGEYYLEKMLEHHRSIGIKHFLLIDNGSADKTRDIAAAYSDVSVYANALPVKEYESLLRSQIARQVVDGGWFLFVDSDELVAFSRGEDRRVSDFLEYCNAHGYNAVVGQVLDLFSPISLKLTSEWSYSKATEAFDLYSINNISSYEYTDTTNISFSWYLRNNECSNKEIKFMFGGIRNEVFGENCCLTTHRLVRNLPHIELYSHPHCSGNIHCADFTFLIKHYKFAGNFWEREHAQVQRENWDHGEDQKRMSVLAGRDDFLISGREQSTLHSTEELIENGFLECSEQFLNYFPRKRNHDNIEPVHE